MVFLNVCSFIATEEDLLPNRQNLMRLSQQYFSFLVVLCSRNYTVVSFWSIIIEMYL